MVEGRLVGLLAHQRRELGGAGAGVADGRVGEVEGVRNSGRRDAVEEGLHCASTFQSSRMERPIQIGMSFRPLN